MAAKRKVRPKSKSELSLGGAFLSAVIQGGISGTGVLPMIPSIGVILGLAIVAGAAVWKWTISAVVKALVLVALAIFAIGMSAYVYSQDRPILVPSIGGLITQNYRGSEFALDVELAVKNRGMQSAFADKWSMDLILGGLRIQSRQLFGERLPEGAANLPPIDQEEFLRGKTVRGWLVFAFPATSHDEMMQYFTCGSKKEDAVMVHLSVVDSLEKKEWVQDIPLNELSKQLCNPLGQPNVTRQISKPS